MTKRMRMALTVYYTAFHSPCFTRSCEKGHGNGRILANGKSISRIPFRTEKQDYEGCPQFPKRFSGRLPFPFTSNRNFRIFWLNGKHPRNPAFQEDLRVVDNECILVKRGRDISNISVTSLSCKHILLVKRFCPEGLNDAEKILLTLRARLFFS